MWPDVLRCDHWSVATAALECSLPPTKEEDPMAKNTAQQVAQAALDELHSAVTQTSGPTARHDRYVTARFIAEHSEDLARLRSIANDKPVPRATAVPSA